MSELITVTSKENSHYKAWLKLTQRKYRDRERLLLIEGELLISDALSCDAVLEEIIISSALMEPEKIFPGVETDRYILSENLFGRLTDTEHGRDVIGVFRIPGWTREDFGDSSGRNILLLDEIQDPGNMGTMIRTADAAGYKGVIAIKGSVDPFSPKVVRSAAGSVFRVPILIMERDEAIELVREEGYRIVGASGDANMEFWDEKLDSNIALAIGNEGRGLSEKLISEADSLIRIPMDGRIESLNAAISSSVIMYESVRQKRI